MGDSSRKAIVKSSANSPISTPQSTWDLNIFEDSIKFHGYNAEVQRAIMCPCMNMATKSALSNCMNCGGTGWFYVDRSTTFLLCQGMSNINKYDVWSEVNRGTVSISARQEDKLGFMDRVSLLELEAWFSEVKQVHLSSTNKNFFFLTYQPLEFLDIYLFAASNEPLVVVDKNKYTIDGNKIVFISNFIEDFKTSNGDLTEVVATVRYTHNPTYHVIDVNRDLIKQPGKVQCGGDPINCDNSNAPKSYFPIKCVGRRAHFVLDQPNFNGDRLFDNTNYKNTLVTETGVGLTTEDGSLLITENS